MNQPLHQNQNFIARIELGFWNLTIQALSQSALTRLLLRKSYKLVRDQQTATFGLLLGASGLVGLVSGYLFYFATVLR